MGVGNTILGGEFPGDPVLDSPQFHILSDRLSPTPTSLWMWHQKKQEYTQGHRLWQACKVSQLQQNQEPSHMCLQAVSQDIWLLLPLPLWTPLSTSSPEDVTSTCLKRLSAGPRHNFLLNTRTTEQATASSHREEALSCPPR